MTQFHYNMFPDANCPGKNSIENTQPQLFIDLAESIRAITEANLVAFEMGRQKRLDEMALKTINPKLTVSANWDQIMQEDHHHERKHTAS